MLFELTLCSTRKFSRCGDRHVRSTRTRCPQILAASTACPTGIPEQGPPRHRQQLVCVQLLWRLQLRKARHRRPVIVDHRDSSAGDRGMADYRHGQLSTCRMAAARAHSFAPSAAGASSSSSSRSPRMWENRIIPTTSCLACRLARPYCGGLQTGVDRSPIACG
eukprot:COSAG06_NODE_21231_length_761_cov_0.435435_1_plen_164_part_00